MNSHEHKPNLNVRNHELPQAEHIQEHYERLNKHHENIAETGPDESRMEHEARHEAHQEATPTAEHHNPVAEKPQNVEPITKSEKARSFDTTMAHTRSQLSRPERSFSKIIHTPVIEKVSETAGKTIARPSGILGAAIASLIGLLSIYGVARFMGFPLSGSEMPLLLLGGFMTGLFLEWVYKSIRTLAAPSHR